MTRTALILRRSVGGITALGEILVRRFGRRSLIEWGLLAAFQVIVTVVLLKLVYSREHRWGEFVPVGVVLGFLTGLLCGWRIGSWRGLVRGMAWGATAGVTDLAAFYMACVSTDWSVEWLAQLPVSGLILSAWIARERASRAEFYAIVAGVCGTEFVARWCCTELLNAETFQSFPAMQWRFLVAAVSYCLPALLLLAFAKCARKHS